jgi:hypothetical protein
MQERIIFILIRFTTGRLVQQFAIPTVSRFDFSNSVSLSNIIKNLVLFRLDPATKSARAFLYTCIHVHQKMSRCPKLSVSEWKSAEPLRGQKPENWRLSTAM